MNLGRQPRRVRVHLLTVHLLHPRHLGGTVKKRQFMTVGLVLAGQAVCPQVRAAGDGLLIYCGITMVRPVTELAKRFEMRERVRITISQGGSEDLYKSLRKSRRGDLYLPGEPSYRAMHLSEGLLGDYRTVGYNQMAIFVTKGNPKHVKAHPHELLRPDLTLILGNAQSGSVGHASKALLDRYNLYPKAVAKSALLLPDSRSLTLSLKRGEADVTLCWRATAFFPDNAPFMDVLDLPADVASPQALQVSRLNFSINQTLATRFMDFMASPEGQSVFREYGFLDADMRA